MTLKLQVRENYPWYSKYRPETDVSPELLTVNTTYLRSLIVFVRWIVEFVRVGITMETSALEYMIELQHEVHKKQVFHMFAILKGKNNILMVFDPTKHDIDLYKLLREDLSETAYGECKEKLPPNALQERGIGMTMRFFLNSYHARYIVTWHSRTGFSILLNNAPIYRFSKNQTSIEASSFRLEF